MHHPHKRLAKQWIQINNRVVFKFWNVIFLSSFQFGLVFIFIIWGQQQHQNYMLIMINKTFINKIFNNIKYYNHFMIVCPYYDWYNFTTYINDRCKKKE